MFLLLYSKFLSIGAFSKLCHVMLTSPPFILMLCCPLSAFSLSLLIFSTFDLSILFLVYKVIIYLASMFFKISEGFYCFPYAYKSVPSEIFS
jgi:hypothetical protein